MNPEFPKKARKHVIEQAVKGIHTQIYIYTITSLEGLQILYT